MPQAKHVDKHKIISTKKSLSEKFCGEQKKIKQKLTLNIFRNSLNTQVFLNKICNKFKWLFVQIKEKAAEGKL